MTNKLIEDVIKKAIGDDAMPIVHMLKNKKNVSEFQIADVIKRPINETRNTLYRLYHANLVTSIRKKDKKKGWYIYYWTFNLKRIKYLAVALKKQRLDRLKERLERENQSDFYMCPDNCIRLDFEQATDFSYKCPECGQIMQLEDNQQKIVDIKKEIRALENELKK